MSRRSPGAARAGTGTAGGELDGVAVAASGRWYERDHDSRIGAAKFVSLTPAAELVEGVVTLHLRRIPGAVHVPVGDAG
jgi:hypothetical protein